MCAILGYYNLDEKTRKSDEFKNCLTKLFLNSEERGTDASGFAYVRNGKIKKYKKDLPANKLVESEPFEKLLNNLPKILIGHCRLTTQGTEKNNTNNHPLFDKPSGTALVHNGVINNDDELFKKYKLKRDGQVDSEIILKMISSYSKKLNIINKIKHSTKKLKGQFAVAVINENEPDNLYLFKNDNPICYVYEPKLKTIFFGSTIEILQNSLEKIDYKLNYFPYTKENKNLKYGQLLSDSGLKINSNGIKEFDIEPNFESVNNHWNKKQLGFH